MPHSGSRGSARTKLADVLADIRNSRAEHLGANQDYGPSSAKRRSAVNYVELSGNQTRSTRSGTQRISNNISQCNSPDLAITPNRKRTYNLKLFDRSLDLAQFVDETNKYDGKEYPLYPVCRSWLEDDNIKGVQDMDLTLHSQQPSVPDHNISSRNIACKNSEKVTNRRFEKIEDCNSPNACSTPEITASSSPAADIFRLPPPLSSIEVAKKLGASPAENDINLRVPSSVRDFKPAPDLERTFDKTFNTMARHECLEINRDRWKKVREDWKKANSISESRYHESFKILNDMFKAHQKEF